jgi:lambda family phage portal protein
MKIDQRRWQKAEQKRREIMARYGSDNHAAAALAGIRALARQEPLLPTLQADLVTLAIAMSEYDQALLAANRLLKLLPGDFFAARAAAEKPGHYKQTIDAVGAPGSDTDEAGQFVQDIKKGDYGILPPGWEFQLDDVTHPTTAYPDFVKAALRSIASGLGVGYNTLANDLEGVNYTSLRMGALNERAVWEMLQEWFCESFVQPVYEAWLEAAMALGNLTYANGAPLAAIRMREYRRTAWQCVRWPWVDPAKEAAAQEKQIQLRLRSVSEIIREAGREPSEVWAELAQDRS